VVEREAEPGQSEDQMRARVERIDAPRAATRARVVAPVLSDRGEVRKAARRVRFHERRVLLGAVHDVPRGHGEEGRRAVGKIAGAAGGRLHDPRRPVARLDANAEAVLADETRRERDGDEAERGHRRGGEHDEHPDAPPGSTRHYECFRLLRVEATAVSYITAGAGSPPTLVACLMRPTNAPARAHSHKPHHPPTAPAAPAPHSPP